MSQSAAILKYLKEGNSITPLEALEMFGCLRLGARIQDLEAEGYTIDSKMIDLPNGKRVAQYRLTPAQAHPASLGGRPPQHAHTLRGSPGELFETTRWGQEVPTVAL